MGSISPPDQVCQLGGCTGRVPQVRSSSRRGLRSCSNERAAVRSRSVFERAMDVDPTNIKLWLSYTEMARCSAPWYCPLANPLWPSGAQGPQHLSRPQPLRPRCHPPAPNRPNLVQVVRTGCYSVLRLLSRIAAASTSRSCSATSPARARSSSAGWRGSPMRRRGRRTSRWR